MIYCFVHAPNRDGWQGELVLALQKSHGKFKLIDVQVIIQELYPNDDPDLFYYEQNVMDDEGHVLQYIERRNKGIMQRRSLYGLLEDMHRDEWEKVFRDKYPDIFWMLNPNVREAPRGSQNEEYMEPNLPDDNR